MSIMTCHIDCRRVQRTMSEIFYQVRFHVTRIKIVGMRSTCCVSRLPRFSSVCMVRTPHWTVH